MRNLKGISKDLNYKVGYGRGYKKGLEEGRKEGRHYSKPIGLLNKLRFIIEAIKVILNNKTKCFTLKP